MHHENLIIRCVWMRRCHCMTFGEFGAHGKSSYVVGQWADQSCAAPNNGTRFVPSRVLCPQQSERKHEVRGARNQRAPWTQVVTRDEAKHDKHEIAPAKKPERDGFE